MTAVADTCRKSFRLGRWRLAVVLLVCAFSGCTGWNVRDGGFHENDLSAAARKARPPEKDIDYWSFSNKGRQIERDLHAL